MLIISPNEMTFYDVNDFIIANAGGVLLNFSSPLWDTIPDGNYWSGTRVSCSRQAVVRINGGNKKVEKWDKTFRAKAVVLK
jgi:hypothetical protein